MFSIRNHQRWITGYGIQGVVFWLPPIQRELAVWTADQIVTLFIRAEIPSCFNHLPIQLDIKAQQRGIPGIHTLSVLQSHPRFPSCGQEKNVALRASAIFELVGSSICAGSEVFRVIAIIIAHPHSGEKCRCSVKGSSPSSQPSRDRSQRKQVVLSGLSAVGV